MRKLILLTAVFGLAVWSLPSEAALAAQLPAYSLTDVGTFGGPQAFLNLPGVPITAGGAVLGTADTTIADTDFPNSNPFLFGADPDVLHAFVWRDDRLIDLGALPGNNASALYQINRADVGAGLSETGTIDPLTGYPAIHAVLFQNGGVTDLGTLPGGHESIAQSVNDRGDVAGFSNNGVPDPNSIFPWDTETRSFVWHDGVMHDLGTLGGPDALMNNMNAGGQIAGDSYTNDTRNPTGIGGFCPPTGTPTTHPFLWTDGHMRDLGTLGGTASVTSWLNDRGEVVGQDYLAGNQACRPFLWDGRRLVDLGSLGGDQGAASYINDAGVVVGWSLLPGDSTAHAFEWRNGTMTDLTGSNSPDCTIAERVNNSGVVVGDTCGQAQDDALIWIHGHQYDLNNLVPQTDVDLTDAQSINNRGQIVALGQLPNGDQHIFLLTPARRALQSTTTSVPRSPATSEPEQISAFPWRALVDPKPNPFTPRPGWRDA